MLSKIKEKFGLNNSHQTSSTSSETSDRNRSNSYDESFKAATTLALATQRQRSMSESIDSTSVQPKGSWSAVYGDESYSSTSSVSSNDLTPPTVQARIDKIKKLKFFPEE